MQRKSDWKRPMESDELAARELVLFVPFEITLSYLV